MTFDLGVLVGFLTGLGDVGLQGRRVCEGVRVSGLGIGLGSGLGRMVDMEENIELEEGEACFAKDDDDTNIDPDIALSYIVRVSLCFARQLFSYFPSEVSTDDCEEI